MEPHSKCFYFQNYFLKSCFMLCIISIFMTPCISVFQTQTQRSRKNENTKEGQAGRCITCVSVRHCVRVLSISLSLFLSHCLSHFHRHCKISIGFSPCTIAVLQKDSQPYLTYFLSSIFKVLFAVFFF